MERRDADPATTYPVVVVYRRQMGWTDRLLQTLGAGEFTHCELYFPLLQVTFAVFIPGSMRCDTTLWRLYAHPVVRYKFAWHLLQLNRLEYDALLAWNVSLQEHHRGYNLADLMWQAAPLVVQGAIVRDLTDSEAHMPGRVFCSQAVVLAMRAASGVVSASARFRAFTHSMNSRLTTPTDMAVNMTQYLGVEINTGAVPLTGQDVDSHLREVQAAAPHSHPALGL
jgi:hypothetical protein